jgi:two-component system, NtrC family, response regulator AtoC
METKRPDGSAGGEPVLIVATPSGFTAHVRFATAVVVAGRDADLALTIPDDSVSRRHAEFRLVPLAVRDLGSTNGTRVQGEPVGAAWMPLAIGSVVEVGDAVVLVRSSTAVGEALIPSRRADRRPLPRVRVAVDPAMVRLYELVELVATSRLGVLILGETGVGKEVIARAIHEASDRREARLLAINCAAIAPTLLESELFGHVKGAFTGATASKPGLFEAASGGTVFLDEVGEMPRELQAKLLRVLESGEVMRVGALEPITVDVRFIAATNRDLARLANTGEFRLDLLFRLSGVTLAIPPLRERPDDIEALARHFLAALRPRAELTAAAIAALRAHPWPGNARELRNTIERAELLSRGAAIDTPHLTFGAGIALATAQDPERERILAALDACGGNQSRAAKALGISRATLVRRLEVYGVARPRK